MDITITLTLEQGIEVQSAISTRLYHLREYLDRLKKISGAEESITFTEQEIQELESAKAIVKEAIIS